MRASERRLGIRQTRALLEAEGEDIVFHRPPTEGLVSDGRGGFVEGVPTDLDPQLVLVNPQSRSLSNRLTGEVTPSRGPLLIGMPTLDVEADDWFAWEDKAFRVTFVEPERSVQTLVQLAEFEQSSD